jgi:hypothetical protein
MKPVDAETYVPNLGPSLCTLFRPQSFFKLFFVGIRLRDTELTEPF